MAIREDKAFANVDGQNISAGNLPVTDEKLANFTSLEHMEHQGAPDVSCAQEKLL